MNDENLRQTSPLFSHIIVFKPCELRDLYHRCIVSSIRHPLHELPLYSEEHPHPSTQQLRYLNPENNDSTTCMGMQVRRELDGPGQPENEVCKYRERVGW